MRTTVTVISTRDGCRTDTCVHGPAGTPVGEVLERLADLAGLAPGTQLIVQGLTPDPMQPAGSALREGSIVSTALLSAGPPLRPGDYLELQVLGGPAAGHGFTVRPGMTMVGRGVARGICVDDPQISRRHLELHSGPDGVTVADSGSTNGSRLDGTPLGSSPRVLRPGMRLLMGESTLELALRNEPPVAAATGSVGSASFNRPPRLDAPQPGATGAAVRFPAAPAPRVSHRLPLLAIGAPLLLGIGLAAVMRRPEFLLFTLLSPVMAFGQWVSDRTGSRRTFRAEEAVYLSRLEAARAELAAVLTEEVAARRRQWPDAAALLKIAQAPSARLWERRRNDADFLHVRLGSGSCPALARILDGSVRAESTPPPQVADVPITLSLPDVGVLGIAGDRGRVTASARFLLGQLAALHRPGDLSLVLLTDTARAESWDWIRWLPHLRPEVLAARSRLLVGLDPESVGARVAELVTLIGSRSSVEAFDRHARRPAAVVVVLDGARALRNTPGLARILADGPPVQVYSICLDTAESLLPEECAAVALTTGRHDTRMLVRRTGGGPDVQELIADGVDVAWADRLARALAPIQDVTAEGDGLPASVSWIELAGLDRDGLSADISQRWDRPCGVTRGSTTVLLGSGVDGPVFVDIARDGPHALVAGTTGSGKSELLQTLVAGLAAANRPDELALVLVDYKGGAAFGACAALPHTVGMVTDLDSGLVERALVSLTAELKRRESVLAAVGAIDIDGFRAAGGALARLVIVVDEFASLAEELPDFVHGLVGVAQRGRSLGVHLVLATQRPEGVVSADIRANTNLRICLSVMRDTESRDVIDTGEAARIARTTPGRGYLRTGHGELRAFQTGRVGGSEPNATTAGVPGDPDVAAGAAGAVFVHPSPFRSLAQPVSHLGLSTHSAPTGDAGSAAAGKPTDLDLIVAACRSAAERGGMAAPRSPWLDGLPAVVASPPSSALTAVIGIQDVPSRQSRQDLVVDLSAAGHLLVVGSARSGRTTLLRTLVGALARSTPVRDLHLYGIDGGGGGLTCLDALPHCGGVVSVGLDEPDRARRLLAMLAAELARRQALLAADGFGSITEQRAAAVAGPAGALPHLMLAIDGWEAFVAAFHDVDGGAVVDSCLQLLRDGRAAGVHLVITADRAGLIGRLPSLIDCRLVLRLADRTDFSLIGLSVRSLPTQLPPGRGYAADGLLETQVCLLGNDASGPAQLADLAAVARRATERDSSTPREARPRRVDVLPTRVPLPTIRPTIRPAIIAATGDQQDRGVVTLGIGGDELGPVTADLLELGPGFVISGPPRSGRSTALATVAVNLRSSGWLVVAVTPRPSPLRNFAEVSFDPADPALSAAVSAAGELPAGRPFALLVDDAELVADSAGAAVLDHYARHARDRGQLMIIAGTTEELSVGFRGFVVEARRSRSGVILAPRGSLDGELLGVRLPRRAGGLVPVGRGVAVARGETTVLQVAVPL